MATFALPFLAALKKASPDFSGMTQEDAQPDVPVPAPDLSVGQPTPPPQPTPDPNQPLTDLSQSMVQGQGAPKLATETKGHKLLQILLGGLKGAATGAGQRTFGEGFQQAQMFPLAVQHQQLQNEQVRQLLPFLRANQIAGLQKTSAEAQKNLAEAGKASAEVEGMPIKQALEKAQTEAAYYKSDPNFGLIDIRTGKPTTEGVAPLSPSEAQALGKQPGELVPIKVKNTASEIANRGYMMVTTNEGVFLHNRNTGTMERLGSNPRLVFAPSERYVPVVDPKNPGNILYRKVGEAAADNLSSPQSAETQTAKATARAIAPGGKVGEEINAFNTAIQHADLLKTAIAALNNGDNQTLNSLKNRFKTEFGIAGPITAQAIADAYQREVVGMLSKGHMTDAEIGSVGKTLNVNAQAPQQTLGVIDAYRALAQSKMNVRQQGVERGLKGQANFPAQQQHVIQIGNQKYQYKGTGATDDLRNYTPIP